MRVIIAGGRDFVPSQRDEAIVSTLLALHKATEVVSGGAAGADRFGEDVARAAGLPVRMFRADWDKHGKAAGPLRNREMAEYADAIILFPGGRGTRSMFDEAVRRGLQLLYVRFE